MRHRHGCQLRGCDRVSRCPSQEEVQGEELGSSLHSPHRRIPVPPAMLVCPSAGPLPPGVRLGHQGDVTGDCGAPCRDVTGLGQRVCHANVLVVGIQVTGLQRTDESPRASWRRRMHRGRPSGQVLSVGLEDGVEGDPLEHMPVGSTDGGGRAPGAGGHPEQAPPARMT